MKKLFAICLVTVAAIGVFVYNSPKSDGTSSVLGALDFSSITKSITTGAHLLDVRTPEEFALGHFPGAVNISLQDLEADKLPDFPKDSQIYLYCRTGIRAGKAAELLKNAGFTKVSSLGGLTDIQKLGGNLIKQQ